MNNLRTYLSFFFIILTFSISLGAWSMSFLNPLKTCVFSSIKAKITMNGKPVKNATVIRRWEWHKLEEERTQTDLEGFFSFPAAFESSVTRALPVELVIGQSIHVVVDGEEKKIWSNSKRKPEENAELGGRPMVMSCELTHEVKTERVNGGILSTMCVLL